MDNNYDKIIDMLCLTGKLPLGLFDAVCESAHNQIYKALDKAQIGKVEEREREIFGERKSAQTEWKSAWLDYEMAYASNFSMD